MKSKHCEGMRMRLGRVLEGVRLENAFSYFLFHLQGLQMVRHCGYLWVTQKHTLSLRFVSVV